MKIKDCTDVAEDKHNPYQYPNGDDRKVHQENSIFSCLQSEELFSRGMDTQQTEGTFSPLSHCNDFDDTVVHTEWNPKIVTIPNDWLKKVADDFLKGDHLDSPGERGRNGI